MVSIVRVITQIQTKEKCYYNLVHTAQQEKVDGSRLWSSLQGLLVCFTGHKQTSENRFEGALLQNKFSIKTAFANCFVFPCTSLCLDSCILLQCLDNRN